MSDIIHKMYQGCKVWLRTHEELAKDRARGLIVLSVGCIGYGLGTLHTRGSPGQDFTLDETYRQQYVQPLPTGTTMYTPTTTVEHSAGKQIVVSKKGKKYHYVWCKGAQSISVENRRYFKTVAEAQAAGYSPASNCPGLK